MSNVDLEGVEFNKIQYKGKSIQTYSFGTGTNVVLAFPAFPHSGLIYAHLFRQYQNCNLKFITLDIPGWIGASEDIFADREFTFEECVRICLKVLKEYEVEEYSVIGFSFGTAVQTALAYYDADRIDKCVFVSPMINCNLGKKDGNLKLVDILQRINAHKTLKNYIKSRYYLLYKDDLINSGMEKNFLALYEQYIRNSKSRTLLRSLYRLFHSDLTLYLNKIRRKPVMVLNSIDENDMFKENASLIRRVVTNQEDIFLEGRHEDFVLKPETSIVKKVFDFIAENNDIATVSPELYENEKVKFLKYNRQYA